mmetsp:Transcript_22556/g.49336  ORF Transcript_22556/g.49336 Transcript_22556/m.49336 type:complete len:254 (-) Transcript_22556:158-919(-)
MGGVLCRGRGGRLCSVMLNSNRACVAWSRGRRCSKLSDSGAMEGAPLPGACALFPEEGAVLAAASPLLLSVIMQPSAPLLTAPCVMSARDVPGESSAAARPPFAPRSAACTGKSAAAAPAGLVAGTAAALVGRPSAAAATACCHLTTAVTRGHSSPEAGHRAVLLKYALGDWDSRALGSKVNREAADSAAWLAGRCPVSTDSMTANGAQAYRRLSAVCSRAAGATLPFKASERCLLAAPWPWGSWASFPASCS